MNRRRKVERPPRLTAYRPGPARLIDRVPIGPAAARKKIRTATNGPTDRVRLENLVELEQFGILHEAVPHESMGAQTPGIQPAWVANSATSMTAAASQRGAAGTQAAEHGAGRGPRWSTRRLSGTSAPRPDQPAPSATIAGQRRPGRGGSTAKVRPDRYLSVRSGKRMVGSPALRWDGPGLTGGCRAGFTFHSHLPACAGLTVGSTCCHRATPGGVCLRRECGEVTGGVEIPVEDQAARLTRVFTLGQGEFGFHCATARAGFGGGIPAVGYDQPSAVPGGFVGQLPADLGEPGVSDVPANRRLRSIPATLRSSTTTVP